MNENLTEQIENYAHLINESTNIDCNSLVMCLDEISKTFEAYLKIIETVDFLMRIFICWHFGFILFNFRAK